jgi:hypothetical protein
VYDALQPRRRQGLSGGISRAGSSTSDSPGVGVEDWEGYCRGGWKMGLRGGGGVAVTVMPLGPGPEFWPSDALEAATGVSSTVEWVPVVQGGMERNSSNVRTRGLQQFQPQYTKRMSAPSSSI